MAEEKKLTKAEKKELRKKKKRKSLEGFQSIHQSW